MSRIASKALFTHNTNIYDTFGQKGEEAFIIIAYKWSTLGVPDYNNPIQSYLELIFCM